MIVRVERLLNAAQLEATRRCMARGAWGDGRATAGHQSAQVKSNLQLAHTDPAAREAAEIVIRTLESNALFVSATLPHHLYPPLFNRYDAGMTFGVHVDNAVRPLPGSHHRLRSDVSATLFLSAPEDYDGGELVIEDTYGAHAIKLAAGDLVVYASSSLHHVEPVTRGTRCAAILWVQSMVRDDSARNILFELDMAIRDLTQQGAQSESLLRLTSCYHNLLRRWAEM
ncbi:MAG TPA: Fe2+-dependent dioxygenase [Steroidobacteraceae bacterium]|jgi:PKHD-type hydroxylase